MVNVTREQALCIPFQLQFNEENIVKEKKKFEPPSDEFDVCYLDDPTIPVLVLKQRIYGNPFVFKEYMSTAEAPLEEQASGEDQKLVCCCCTWLKTGNRNS